jgi:hypothetical protein
MKKIYFTFFLFSFLISGLANAQITTIAQDFVQAEFEVDADNWGQDIEAKLRLKYEGQNPTKLVWVREIIKIEDAWETAVCDPVLCYFPHVNSMSFDVQPGEEFDIAAHLYPRANPGDSAKVIIELYDENNPDVRINLTYYFTPPIASSTENVLSNSSAPSLFPNPAHDLLHIKNDEKVNRVEFFNLLGQRIYSSQHNSGASINISHLNDGMYFVKMMDKNKAVIRTLRLNKR